MKEVPNHVLITRNSGKVSIHGNTKNAMHLVRIMRMGVEILRDHQVNILRPDAQDLLDIRKGKYTIDQIFKWNDDLYAQLQYWRDNTTLPDEPDRELINRSLVKMTEEYLYGKSRWSDRK